MINSHSGGNLVSSACLKCKLILGVSRIEAVVILNNKSIQETQKELLLMIFEWKVDMRGIYHKGNANANSSTKTEM